MIVQAYNHTYTQHEHRKDVIKNEGPHRKEGEEADFEWEVEYEKKGKEEEQQESGWEEISSEKIILQWTPRVL